MFYCYRCLKSLGSKTHYGLHGKCFEEWFGIPYSEKFISLTPKSTQMPHDPTIQNSPYISSFFHGKFKKYAAELAGKKYILKVVQDEFPNLPWVEYVSNKIATQLKIKVPDYYLIRFEEKDCFVSRNFMDKTYWKKLTHLYHYLKKGDKFDVETIKTVIFDITKNPLDVEMFYQTLLFDALIGNHDRHGRNFGFLIRGKTHRLAPIYDNPSYIGVETLLGADLNPTGKIATKNSMEPSMKDYVLELKRLKAIHTLKMFKKRCSLKKILNIIENSLMIKPVQQAITRLIKKRYEEFQENY